MWIVALALRRPYTFIVMALLILILTPIVILRTPTDIFPDINIPVVSIVWNYTGLAPQDMSDRIVSVTERALTTLVNDIDHIESQSLNGIAVVKVFFRPNANIPTALAQVTAISQTQLKQLPAGTTPPLIIQYSASSVPIVQIGLSSKTLAEQQLFDYATNFIRTQLITIPGVAIPWPYGGKQRQIQVDINTPALQAKHLAPVDVVNAISAQNLILPMGTAKLGALEYQVQMNASPKTVAELNDLPIKTVDGTTIYIHDVAHVRDGFSPQTNIVRQNGTRGTLITVLKNGGASTIDIVDNIKTMLPQIASTLPEELKMNLLFDQSLFVRAAIKGVIREALTAACLTAAMILLFLGNWRSTLIIAISIPLSILVSVLCLSALGETFNIMTLGGLALAVGILVDDATVEIENIERNLGMKKELKHAILDGAQQIAVPALVSTLAICIVFVPMFLLSGVARYLFVPLAEAVVFAMLTSYLLSRTLIPTLAKYWLRTRAQEEAAAHAPGPMKRLQLGFERRFEALRHRYQQILTTVLHHRGPFMTIFLSVAFASMLLYPFLGSNFFPEVDAGQIKLHMRAPTGLRVEDTAGLADHVEVALRKVIAERDIASIVDNVGPPVSSINTTYSNSGTIGSSDADILISLNPGHGATAQYVRQLREQLPREFPGTTFSFLPADIVSQILNFGVPAPIDVQISGPSSDNREVANKLLESLRHVPGLVDLRLQQVFNQPELRVVADRSRAQQLGINQHDIASDVLLTLSGSGQIAPTFWLNPDTGLQYPLVTQAPQYRMASLQDLQNLPVSAAGQPQILGGLATITRGFGPAIVSHRDSQPILDIFGAAQGRDLGALEKDIRAKVAAIEPNLPRGTHIVLRGQVQTMSESYDGLAMGLIGAIVLIYLLIVINFQSWLDPFIIITALPAAVAGIAWMLLITGTTLSVPALTGAIMCMGVATANSILVVSFARDRMGEGATALQAAYDAGVTRFRPVLMTALAMGIGMLPMSLGLGEGGEQNAPLGRAVIGGLLLATLATLIFVPVVFAAIHGRRERRAESSPAPAV